MKIIYILFNYISKVMHVVLNLHDWEYINSYCEYKFDNNYGLSDAVIWEGFEKKRVITINYKKCKRCGKYVWHLPLGITSKDYPGPPPKVLTFNTI